MTDMKQMSEKEQVRILRLINENPAFNRRFSSIKDTYELSDDKAAGVFLSLMQTSMNAKVQGRLEGVLLCVVSAAVTLLIMKM